MNLMQWVHDVVRTTLALKKGEPIQGIRLQRVRSKKKPKARKQRRIVKKLKKAA